MSVNPVTGLSKQDLLVQKMIVRSYKLLREKCDHSSISTNHIAEIERVLYDTVMEVYKEARREALKEMDIAHNNLALIGNPLEDVHNDRAKLSKLRFEYQQPA